MARALVAATGNRGERQRSGAIQRWQAASDAQNQQNGVEVRRGSQQRSQTWMGGCTKEKRWWSPRRLQ
jgi:hypothetical protein